MDIASDLALIDRLCARDFSEAQRHFLVRLGPVEWEDPDDCYAYELAVADRLTARWGEAARRGTVTWAERIARGEEIPEPWAMLSALAYELRVWQAGETGRTVTLAVADRDADEQAQLVVGVTDLDPP
ncbi:hypothetical protein AB0I00_22285 [Streptomyces sp. NPDC050803]|uniref:hypothetical protein n=1 Tax=unclassified Streptomyces TaxID=2593676 RepID=UPI003413272B